MPPISEEAVAKLLESTQGWFGEDGHLANLQGQVKALEAELGTKFAGLDLKQLSQELEKIKAGHEQIQNAIKSHKGGLYFAGVEDGLKNFSLVRAVKGYRAGKTKAAFEDVGAGYEFEFLKTAYAKHADVYGKTQQAGDDELGGYFIPDQVIPDVIGAIYTRSAFIGLQGDDGETNVSVLDNFTGGQVKWPKFDGGLIAYWRAELEDAIKSSAKLEEMTFTPKALTVLARMTQTMRDMAGFGWETAFRRDMSKALAKKLDWTIAYGTGGDNMPMGIVNQPDIKVFRAENDTVYDKSVAADITALEAISDWDGGELDFDKLDLMDLAIEEDDIDKDESNVTITSPRAISHLKRLKIKNFTGQTDGQPFLLGAPMLSDARLADMVGRFSKTNQIKSNLKPGASVGGATDSTDLKHTDVFKGNMGQVYVGRWAGIEVVDDGGLGTHFASRQTNVLMELKADVGVGRARELVVCPDARVRD